MNNFIHFSGLVNPALWPTDILVFLVFFVFLVFLVF